MFIMVIQVSLTSLQIMTCWFDIAHEVQYFRMEREAYHWSMYWLMGCSSWPMCLGSHQACSDGQFAMIKLSKAVSATSDLCILKNVQGKISGQSLKAVIKFVCVW